MAFSALTGCASAASDELATASPRPTVDASAGTNALPPVMTDVNAVDGKTVEVALSTVIVLTGGGEDHLEWSGRVTDPTVATFIPGEDHGSYQTNPGVTPLTEGRTTVTLENGRSGAVATFTVVVRS